MPTVCGVNKIDSNVTGLAFAEEECLKQLPGVGGADAIWYGLEPNSYSDFGGQLTTVARSPINPSRQRQKGVVTDLDASGGFNTDVTKSNLLRLMQGFFFANARQQASTRPLNGTAIPITAVDTTNGYGATSGLGIFATGDIIAGINFTNPANNGAKVVTAASSSAVNAAGLVAEASPPANSHLLRVGKQYASADVAMSYAGGVATMTTTAGDFTTLVLIPGQWIFIGGDAANTAFANNVGYARVSAIAAKTLTFDKTTFTPVTEAGTGKTIQIYFGTVIRSEPASANIVRRSYQLERQLGQDASGVQSEYLTGAVPNQFTLHLPSNDKVNADLTFVACGVEQRAGVTGIKPGTRVAAPGQPGINTTSDVYRIRMDVFDSANPNPQALFGYVTQADIVLNNTVTPEKAIGVLGAMDTAAGDFMGSGTVTAYFTTIAATQAVRNNADVGLYTILASKNGGQIYDIPLMSLGGGRISVEKDKSITVPLDINGAQSKFGHTMLFESFEYLPNLAMPSN